MSYILREEQLKSQHFKPKLPLGFWFGRFGDEGMITDEFVVRQERVQNPANEITHTPEDPPVNQASTRITQQVSDKTAWI